MHKSGLPETNIQVREITDKSTKGKTPVFTALLSIILAGLLWFVLFYYKTSLSEWIVYDLFNFEPTEKFPEFLSFFLITAQKIFLLLILMVFIIGFLRSWIPAEKIRNRLTSMPPVTANAVAGGLGVITPYCSCSAIPMFISFLETGIPLGITFSFLIAAPLVNEVIVVMLAGLFGFKIAVIYMFSGLLLAIIAGVIIDRLKLERHLPVWLLDFRSRRQADKMTQSMDSRISSAINAVSEVLSRTWIYILAGVVIGSVIHGYVPDELLHRLTAGKQWYTIPLVVLAGIPLYACPASAAPIAFALVGKGVPLGTSLAFVMAVAGLSLPEFIILRKVISTRLLLLLAGIVFLGIIIIGYLFNWLL